MNKDTTKSCDFMLVVGAALGWSALGSLILLLPTDINPLAISALRGASIAVAFLGIAAHNRTRLLISWPVFCAGLAYGLSALTYIASLRLLPVAMATPLHYTTPAFLIIGSLSLCRKLPSRNDLCGVLLSLLGSLILVFSGSISSWLGVLCAIGSAILWALYLALQDHLSQGGKNSAAIVGGICLLLAGYYELDIASWSLPSWWVMLMIGGISSVLPLLLLARASSVIAPTTASLILLLEPAFATILAAVINGQFPSPSKLLGMIFIVAGAMFGLGLLNWKARPKAVTAFT